MVVCATSNGDEIVLKEKWTSISYIFKINTAGQATMFFMHVVAGSYLLKKKGLRMAMPKIGSFHFPSSDSV